VFSPCESVNSVRSYSGLPSGGYAGALLRERGFAALPRSYQIFSVASLNARFPRGADEGVRAHVVVRASRVD
jgi:hypothetical protein